MPGGPLTYVALLWAALPMIAPLIIGVGT